jgi:hypothetical protein
LQIEEMGEVIRIRFKSQRNVENAKALGILLVIFPGLPFMWAGLNFSAPFSYWIYLFLVYATLAVLLFFYAQFRAMVEIHPERIYVKSDFISSTYEFPVKEKMVLMYENFPWIQLVIPRETWRISIGYEDGVFPMMEELDDCLVLHRIVEIISGRFNTPLVDYTYQDQLDLVMFLKPEEISLPFSRRAAKFPDLIVIGELGDITGIKEEIISTEKKVYTWTPFGFESVGRILVIGLLLALIVWLNIISTKHDALMSLSFLREDAVLYYAILLWVLGSLAYYSGLRSRLTLSADNFTYEESIFRFLVEKKAISAEAVQEVRMKPSTRGFVLLLSAGEDCIIIKNQQGLTGDFMPLLWLTERVQDYLFENREIGKSFDAEIRIADTSSEGGDETP